jgi:hypothetical protein
VLGDRGLAGSADPPVCDVSRQWLLDFHPFEHEVVLRIYAAQYLIKARRGHVMRHLCTSTLLVTALVTLFGVVRRTAGPN